MSFTVQSLLNDEQIASAPILILGNKIDIPGAASEDEIRHYFGLHALTTGKVSLCMLIFTLLFKSDGRLHLQSVLCGL